MASDWEKNVMQITPRPQNPEIHTKSQLSLSSAHLLSSAPICSLQSTLSLDLSVLARAKVRYTKQKRAAESKRSLQLHAAAEQYSANLRCTKPNVAVQRQISFYNSIWR